MMAKELKEWAFILDKMDFISRHMMTNNMTLTPVENSMAIYFQPIWTLPIYGMYAYMKTKHSYTQNE